MTYFFKCDKKYVEAELDGELVLLNLDDGQFFSLTGTAAEVWRLIDHHFDIDGISERLSREYQEDLSIIRQNIEKFFCELLLAGLVEQG